MVASVLAYTQIFHAIYAFAALGAVFAACTVKTAPALGTQLIVGTVFAFFTARNTDHRAVRASVAAGADLIHAVFTYQTFGAVVAFTAYAVKAYSALNAEFFLSAVCTLFAAFSTDIGAFRASVAAGADIFNAHFAESAVGAVIALASAAFKTDPTVAAELIISTAFALLAALGAYYGTF